MPWYTNPVITCKVLNRIANRNLHTPLRNLRSVLDDATESIWKKQERYYKTTSENGECRGFGERPQGILTGS